MLVTGESNQQPSDSEALALPPESQPRHPCCGASRLNLSFILSCLFLFQCRDVIQVILSEQEGMLSCVTVLLLPSLSKLFQKYNSKLNLFYNYW